MDPVAVVGNLSLDRVDGTPARIGGGPYYAARALRLLAARAGIVARCADADRGALLPRIAALGLPVRLLSASATAAFTFRYDGEAREMTVDAFGDAWKPGDVRALSRSVRWVHVAALTRGDFPLETLAALARGRRLLLDAQGLVRARELGPLRVDGDFDRGLLAHVTALKLSEEEAAVVGDVDVPEVIVTLGSQGSIVRANGRELRVAARRSPRDPTGAGDAFAAAYVAGRASGHAPFAAARRATAVVGALLR